MGCGTAGITIISPALSSITKYFSVDEAAAQSLLSGYFIAMAVSQLIYGPLSDRYGRRRPLLVGLAGFALGGLLAASAESFEVLVIARVLPVSYTHLRAHETKANLVCRLLLEK